MIQSYFYYYDSELLLLKPFLREQFCSLRVRDKKGKFDFDHQFAFLTIFAEKIELFA